MGVGVLSGLFLTGLNQTRCQVLGPYRQPLAGPGKGISELDKDSERDVRVGCGIVQGLDERAGVFHLGGHFDDRRAQRVHVVCAQSGQMPSH